MMWHILPYITSGVTLVAFLAAVAAWLHRSKLKHDSELIRSAPQDKRDALISAYLGRFEVDTANLTKQQQYDVVVKQIDGRAQRFKWLVVAALTIAILFTTLAIYAIARAMDTSELNRQISTQLDSLEGLQLQIQELELETIQLSLVSANTAAQTAQIAELAPSHPLKPELLARVRHLISEIDQVLPADSRDDSLNFRIRLAKAKLANSEGRFRDGLRLIRELEGTDEANAVLDVAEVHAASVYGLGMWREALGDYQMLHKVASNAHRESILSRIAICQAELREFDDAYASFSALIDGYRKRLQSGDDGANLSLATSLSNRAASLGDAGRFNEGIEDLNEAIELLETLSGTSARLAHAGALNNRGLFRSSIGELKPAIEDLESAIAIATQLDSDSARKKRSEALGNMGIAYMKLGEHTGHSEHFEAAVGYLDRAIQVIDTLPDRMGRDRDRRESVVRLNRAIVLYKLEKHEIAREAADELIEHLVHLIAQGASELELALANAYHNRSLVFRALDEPDKALEDLNRAIATLDRLLDQQYSDLVAGTLATSLLERARTNVYDERSIGDCGRAIELLHALIANGREDLKEQLADCFNTRGSIHRLLGNFDGAREDFESAIATYREIVDGSQKSMRRNVAVALMNRTAILSVPGSDDDPAEMTKYSDEAIGIFRDLAASGNEGFRLYLAHALKSRGIWHRRSENVPKALKDYSEAIQIYNALENQDTNVVANMAQVYHNRATAYRTEQQWEMATEDYSDAITLRRELQLEDPNSTVQIADGLNWRGRCRWKLKRLTEAISDFDKAIQLLQPIVDRHPQWNANLATSLAFRADCNKDRGRIGLAINDWESVIRRLEADLLRFEQTGLSGQWQFKNWFVDELVNVSWILATHPDAAIRDGVNAENYARRACELTERSDHRCMDCLAAAHAVVGDFDQAMIVVKEAIQVAADDAVPELEARLALYRDGKPFVDQNSAELEMDSVKG